MSSANDKRIITVNYPKFNFNTENPFKEELDRIVDAGFAEATTTRTIKNITETLTKGLRSKYNIPAKDIKQKVHDILRLHGLAPENFDPISIISTLTFTDKLINDISIDDNANKTEVNMEGICSESFLAYKKAAGYDYLYQTIKELYGKEEAKKCSADMYDFSIALNDSSNVLKPYCFCIDASKLVMVGRNFGQVHSAPAKYIRTYIATLGDTIREISFNIAGAVAVGSFFLDIAHLAIYKERISLDDLRTDKKIRKNVINSLQQFIYTVNHYSRNAVESPFVNVSLFDREKLKSLIDDSNYGWYFPKKASVLEDNNIEDNKQKYLDFVLDYIEELQEMYLSVFDKGDPLRNGLQFPFPVSTINIGITINNNGIREITDKNNKLLNYITKNCDISRYNIYCSEGTRVASCCRLLSDADMMGMASGVNSFGGSQISLGSHRVATINIARIAYEAKSYDDFRSILSDRVEEAGKILKAHKILIMNLEKLGKQPWITNGWINMSHMFSTFGCLGYVEAANILKEKFNNVEFDYMKDFLIYFNNECKRVAIEEKIIFNIEAIPGEGMAPKLAKSDIILFADNEGNFNF
jgi:anaerobic ribonucleoside-triphosphate reductase